MSNPTSAKNSISVQTSASISRQEHNPNRFPTLFVTLLLTLSLSVLLGILLLTIAYALPTKNIYQHIEASLPVYQEEGEYPYLIEDNWSTLLDNYTDTLMLGSATYRSGHPFRDALLIPRTRYGELEPFDNLPEIISHRGEAVPNQSYEIYYPRYWHGYLILLKPLLELFTPTKLRILNTALQFALALLTLFLLYKNLGLPYAAAFFSVLAVMNPMVTGRSFQYSDVYYITMLSSIYILHKGKKILKPNCFLHLFFFIGILTAYFDLLTYPLASLGVPLLILLSIQNQASEKPHPLPSALITMLTSSVSWLFGFAAMWASKWVIATAFTDVNVFEDALNQASFRLNGQVTERRMTNMGAVAISRNLERLPETPVILELILFLILMIALILLKQYKLRLKLETIIPQLIIAFYPILWYGTMKNHSFIHRWMTYRSLSILTFSIFLMLAGNMQKTTISDIAKDQTKINS